MIIKQVSAGIVVSPDQNKQIRYTCICCRIKFKSADLQRRHFKTEWHLYNLKRKICDLEPIDLNSFSEIQTATAARQNEEIYDGSESSLKDFIKMQSELNRPTDDEDDDWEKIDHEDFVDEDYNDDEIAEMLAKVVKSDTCLFCNKRSFDITDNVTHMNHMHGFFIPEEKYLINLEGLMEYLGFKVGAGATCLWCNKQFRAVHGARLHMIYKDHCKILYDQDKAIEEFKEFYDYSAQEHIQMKPLDQLIETKKRPERRAEHNRSLIKAKLFGCESKQLIVKKNLSSIQTKSIKKFDAYRAKILLKTGMSDNYNKRSRLRHQNPI